MTAIICTRVTTRMLAIMRSRASTRMAAIMMTPGINECQ
jgi:hypothetical protein